MTALGDSLDNSSILYEYQLPWDYRVQLVDWSVMNRISFNLLVTFSISSQGENSNMDCTKLD